RHAVLPRALSARRRRGHPHPPSFPTRRSSDLAATGAIFGAVDVVTVAFAEERGHKAAASVVLSLYALGSCVAGLVFGLLRFAGPAERRWLLGDRKSTRLNSSHVKISYAVFCLRKTTTGSRA